MLFLKNNTIVLERIIPDVLLNESGIFKTQYAFVM